ncbi:MAG TPA: hypothetical protein VFG66_12960 [Gemmatimonadales bacterium]|nr:hypothetical protein [Gemmatimonadales bacterium]
MTWEIAWAEAAAARRFVERLSTLGSAELRPAVPPILDRDPYLSAWSNVEAALGNAPQPDRSRVQSLLVELDARLESLRLPPGLREAARRAVRALLARRWLLTDESLAFVYEPFETMVPLNSLEA